MMTCCLSVPRLLLLPFVACLFLLAAGGTAQAQSCSFTPTDVVLGPVDVLGAGATSATGNIAVSCASFLGLLSSLEMRIHLGEGSGGRLGALRRMTSQTTTTGLAYELYQDAAHSVVFGGSYSAHGGQPVLLTGGSILSLLTTTGVNVPIYARAPGGQNSVAPGAYLSSFTRNPLDVRVDYRTCTLILICTNRTATFSFNVQAQVQPDCHVQADDMDFGTHGVLDSSVDAVSQIRVTCTAGSPYSLGLGYGLQGSSVDTRVMRDLSGNLIRYDLFHDNTRIQQWGLVSDGLAAISAGIGASQPVSVYGRVPAQPTPAPGAYSDTVVVTVTY